MTLIKDENEIRIFIENVLPPLEHDEVYIVVLTARKKYCPTISSSMEVVARDIIKTNDTDKIIRKLKKLSIVEGLYTDKNGEIIPNDAFVLYILLDPRSMLKAYKEFNKDINEWIYSHLVGEKNLQFYRDIDIKLFSAIHRSPSKKNYFIIDIDKKDETLLNIIVEKLNSIKWVTETRGGYHILVDRCDGEMVYKISQMKLSDVEIKKEIMTPIPGTLQGGFLVHRYF